MQRNLAQRPVPRIVGGLGENANTPRPIAAARMGLPKNRHAMFDKLSVRPQVMT
jgi:hypothetical protein